MASETRVVLIDPRPLTRLSLTYLLSSGMTGNSGSGDSVIWPVVSAEEMISGLDSENSNVRAILLNLGVACPCCTGGRDTREEILRLRARVPEVPLILVSDCGDAEHIRATFRQGVRGYVPTAINPTTFIQAIYLVIAGGTFIPASVLGGAIGTSAEQERERPTIHDPIDPIDPIHPIDPRVVEQLTPRQSEVLCLLRQGKPNKIIAHELGVQESTVKVHVCQIMRKLHANNRTHAVFLAARAG